MFFRNNFTALVEGCVVKSRHHVASLLWLVCRLQFVVCRFLRL